MNEKEIAEVKLLKQIIKVKHNNKLKPEFRICMTGTYELADAAISMKSSVQDYSQEQKVLLDLVEEYCLDQTKTRIKNKTFDSETDLLLSCVNYLKKRDPENYLYNAIKNSKLMSNEPELAQAASF